MSQPFPMCVRACQICSEERLCREFLIIHGGFVVVTHVYTWLCADCLVRQFWYRRMPPESQRFVLDSYADVERDMALEGWLGAQLGETRYAALCESAAALGVKAG